MTKKGAWGGKKNLTREGIEKGGGLAFKVMSQSRGERSVHFKGGSIFQTGGSRKG